MSEKLEFTGLDIDTDSPECIAERERLGKKIANLISDGWIPPWDRHLYWFIGWSNENDKVDYIELCMLGGEKIKFVPQPKPTEGRLLSKEEMDKVPFDMGSPWGLVDRYTVGIAIAKAQLAKDQEYESTILEPRCQARVDGILDCLSEWLLRCQATLKNENFSRALAISAVENMRRLVLSKKQEGKMP